MQCSKRGRIDDDDDAGNMFDSSDAASTALNSVRSATKALKSLNQGLRRQANDAGQSLGNSTWDDEDGYYIATIHETLHDRYIVTDTACGRGVFSSVVKAKDVGIDVEACPAVAIKIVRSNEAFERAALREVEILQKLQACEGEGKRFIVQMMASFSHRKHLCIVFECMWDDCREALRKLTKDKGMTLPVVRVYTQQLLLGLRQLEKCGILHLDIKPDNILISEDQQVAKLCDLGSAIEIGQTEVGAYVMSRSYRAPEIIIGIEPTCAADTFALACTLFELFTGKRLASGKSNHDQLRKLMEVKGKMPPNVIKAGAFWRKHFDENCVFKSDLEADPRHAPVEEVGDPLRLKIEQLKAQMQVFPKQHVKDLVLERVGEERCKSTRPEHQKYVQLAVQFAALLEDMSSWTPADRLKPREGLAHGFFSLSYP